MAVGRVVAMVGADVAAVREAGGQAEAVRALVRSEKGAVVASWQRLSSTRRTACRGRCRSFRWLTELALRPMASKMRPSADRVASS